MITEKEIAALMPKHTPAPLDQVFYRDLVNHWNFFGSPALVRKQGRGWITDFRGHGHPTVYRTKREAEAMATAWVLEVSRAGRHRAAA